MMADDLERIVELRQEIEALEREVSEAKDRLYEAEVEMSTLERRVGATSLVGVEETLRLFRSAA